MPVTPQMKEPGSLARKTLLNGPYAVRSFDDSGHVFVVNSYGKCVAQVDDEGFSFEARCMVASLMAEGLNAARAEVFKGA